MPWPLPTSKHTTDNDSLFLHFPTQAMYLCPCTLWARHHSRWQYFIVQAPSEMWMCFKMTFIYLTQSRTPKLLSCSCGPSQDRHRSLPVCVSQLPGASHLVVYVHERGPSTGQVSLPDLSNHTVPPLLTLNFLFPLFIHFTS